MKKTLVSAILGIAACVAAYGQGTIAFDNYNASPYMPIQYQNGVGAGASVHVDLLYALGVVSDANLLTSLGLDIAINPSLSALGSTGYWNGVNVIIPGYTSGPVTFAVRAWDTATGATYNQAEVKGLSLLWQESSLATGLATANNFAGMPGPNGASLVTLVPIPEPSILALGGLGSLAMLVLRRRK